MEAAEDAGRPAARERQQVRVTRKSLQAVLEQCQRALELLNNADVIDEEKEDEEEASSSRGSPGVEHEADQLCDLLQTRVGSPHFVDKIGSIHLSICHNISEDESTSWEMITATDLWEDPHIEGEVQSDQDGFVLVGEEDIMDAVACFMAAHLVSLKQTHDLNPNQLQEALSKTFSNKKKKGKLRRAWDGSKVVYNVASWGATAVGIYQNPALMNAALTAFWTSHRVVSKFF